MEKLTGRPRTDFPSAVQEVLKVLSDGRPYTIARLAREANLNFRTVKKAIELIEKTQATLQSKRVEVSATSDNHTVIRITEKAGFASLPENIRNMVLKSLYPSITEEDKILVRLWKRGAVSEKTAVEMESSGALERLIEAEHVLRSGTRFYLSKDAQMIAKSALQIYPELKDI